MSPKFFSKLRKSFLSKLRKLLSAQPGSNRSAATIPPTDPTPLRISLQTNEAAIRPKWKTPVNSMKLVIGVAKEMADVFTPLKSALGGLIELMKNIEQTSANLESVQALLPRLGNLEISLTSSVQDGTEYAIKESERREILKTKFGIITDSLHVILRQSKHVAFLNNADDAQNITSLTEGIREAITDYQVSLQQDIFEMNCQHIESDLLNLLDKLPRARDAGFLSGNRKPCLKGTRVELLQEIEDWVDDVGIDSLPIFWLSGAMGTGKTTIAHTLARRIYAEDRLGASFFCSRDYLDRSNIHLIFPTIAFQLAYQLPSFRMALARIIRAQPDVGHQSLPDQLSKLIIDPLRSIGSSCSKPSIIILDALDECVDHEPESAILSLFSYHIKDIPSVKIFITSRPEYPIRNAFNTPLRQVTRELVLQDVDRTIVDHDIETYLRVALSEVITKRRDCNVPLPWPPASDVSTLVQRSGGLFVHASTTVNFIASIYHHPLDRLRLTLSIPGSSIHEGDAGIDALYTGILTHGYKSAGRDDQLFCDFRRVVSCIALAFNPMSRATLATLLDERSENILTILNPLHSVIVVPEYDQEHRCIMAYHRSFPDYLVDQARCGDIRFYMDAAVYHGKLAMLCLELMESRLRRNMCDVPRYAMNADAGDLSAQRKEHFDDAVLYGCRFWAKHLCLAYRTGEDVPTLLENLKRFIQRQMLPWLEVLSVLGDLRTAVYSFLDVKGWLMDLGDPGIALLRLIEDCERFVLNFFDRIQESAPHVYHSALPWSPEISPLRMLYREELLSEVKLWNAIDPCWDDCKRSMHVDHAVKSVAWSHKGDLIAECGGSFLWIFEAATGVCLIKSEGKYGISLSFSPNDGLIACSSSDPLHPAGVDKLVKVLDVQTGQLVEKLTLDEHVTSIAFSPDGTVIAIGTGDRTIRIWRLSSDHPERTLRGHSHIITSVCWLGNQVVSGSWDGVVKVWDVDDRCLRTFELDSFGLSVASSSDGSKIVSWSWDNLIQVYDARSGDTIQTILTNDAVFSTCFSPDGEKIAYGAGATVVVWDIVKAVNVAVYEGHEAEVNSVVFSPDGTCVASGSSDGFVKVWPTESKIKPPDVPGSHTDELGQHSEFVSCVSFSTDGQLIASGSYDTTVKLWNGTTNSLIHTFHGHSAEILSVAFSASSSLLASGSVALTSDESDDTIRIWDIQNRSLIRTILVDGGVIAVGFSPDSDRLVSIAQRSTSKDPVIALWNLESGERLALSRFVADMDSVFQVAFSADGSAVMTSDGVHVQSWNLEIAPESVFKYSALAMVLVRQHGPDDLVRWSRPQPLYRYQIDKEWIFDEDDNRVCWLPVDRRGSVSDHHARKLVVGTSKGRVFMLDFSNCCR